MTATLLELPRHGMLLRHGPHVGYVGPTLAHVRLQKAHSARGYVLLHRDSFGAWQAFRLPGEGLSVARAIASAIAKRTHRKIILGELVQVSKGAEVIRSLAIYEELSQDELLARATDALFNVTELVKASDGNPYNPAEFDRLTNRLARSLNRQASPRFTAAVEKSVDGAKIDWAKASDADLERFSARLAAALGVAASSVWKAIKPQVVEATTTMASSARKAFVREHKFGIDVSLALEDRRAVTRSAVTNVHYVRDFATGRMEPSLSSRARQIVQSGINKGQSSRAIGDELHRALSAAAHGQTEAYFRMAASAINTRSREFSSLRSMQDAGVGAWEWSSVLDERTTETCFAAGTTIRIPLGEVAIERITPGQAVVTGSGLFSVVRGVLVRPAMSWLRIRLSSGRHLTVTPNHPMLTSHGWIKAKDIRPKDKVAAGPLRELQPRVHRKLALQNICIRPVLFPEVLLGMEQESQPVRAKVQALRETVSVKAPRERVDKVLFPPVLLGSSQFGHMGGARVRTLRSVLQGQEGLCGARPVQVLQRQVSAGSEAPRHRSQIASPYLRSVWPNFYHQGNGVSFRENSAPLFQGMFQTQTDDDLRELRDRIRNQEFRGKRQALLLEDVLPQIESTNSPCDADFGDTEGLRNRIPGGGPVRRVEGQAQAGARRFRSEEAQGGLGIRWGVLARSKAERFGRGTQRSAGPRGGTDDGSYPPSGHREEPRELSVADYLACSAGFVTVASVGRIDGPRYCYNLEIKDDPTYIAEGVVVHNCRFLDGKRFSVGGALARYAAADALADPLDIKYEMPWFYERPIRGGEHEGKTGIFLNSREGMQRVAVVEKAGFGQRDTIGSYSNAKNARSLEGMNMSPPPGHGGCRSTSIPVV